MGTIKIKVPTAATPGNPTLVLHGQLGAGTIVVRHENWFERRTKPKGGRHRDHPRQGRSTLSDPEPGSGTSEGFASYRPAPDRGRLEA